MDRLVRSCSVDVSYTFAPYNMLISDELFFHKYSLQQGDY